ncbi:hypothetical protein CRENBAI_008727 [Crenichthys baileyi]|uniref:G-protein coupled receptors family 1 profile domain-containing protein n=1 Tax=Crenichthys baileyi TaxID=28760 RepID=A0AAV9RMR2_9TELE
MKKKVKTTMDKYQLHLSVTDLLFILTLRHGHFRGFLCVSVHVIYTVNLYSRVLILAFISWDSYLSVFRATDSRATRKLLVSRVIYVGVWLPAAILTVPDLVFARVQDHILVCYCIIISSLSRGAKGQVLQKTKALKKTVILVICFFGCWLPYCLGIFVDTLPVLNIVFSSCKVQRMVVDHHHRSAGLLPLLPEPHPLCLPGCEVQPTINHHHHQQQQWQMEPESNSPDQQMRTDFFFCVHRVFWCFVELTHS